MTSRRRFGFGLAAALLALVLGVLGALRSGDWADFARAGAVIALIGALMLVWEALREDEALSGVLRRLAALQLRATEALGLGLALAGGLIWAFGGLLGTLLR